MKWRDLTILDLAPGQRLLIACDATGGIGPKALDQVSVPGYVLGRFTARVALMEVIAAGGRPVALVNTCCVEPDPTGREILRGITDEAMLAGLSPDQITGSFEKNMETSQTGLGVTALALSTKAHKMAQANDLVVAIGLPKVGAEVSLNDPTSADLPLVNRLSTIENVHDLLPVGSRGIAAEVLSMADSLGLDAVLYEPEDGWDLAKSAGPVTSCLVALPPTQLYALALTLTIPWAIVAHLRPTS